MSLLTKEYDLARYVTSLLQVGEKLVNARVTDQGYLQTESIIDCLKISRLDTIIGDLKEKLSHDAFSGAVLSKQSLGNY